MTQRYKEGDVYQDSVGSVCVAFEGEAVSSGEKKLRGKARKIFDDDGTSDQYFAAGETVYVHKGSDLIVCGCHRLPALATFRKLARALGYEVTE